MTTDTAQLSAAQQMEALKAQMAEIQAAMKNIKQAEQKELEQLDSKRLALGEKICRFT